jgi:hypothetical protein
LKLSRVKEMLETVSEADKVGYVMLKKEKFVFEKMVRHKTLVD